MANSTPNYGYDSDIAAISGIDRDLKRVEDKAEANANQVTDLKVNTTKNIAINRERLTALDKRVDKLESIPATMCCKTDIDCLLAKKVDKCDLNMHLKDPDAHKRLFDQKVDKKDGYGLISDSCLRQICQNKDGLVLLEQYIRELQDRNERLEEELANKANKGGEKLTWYSMELLNDFTGSVKFAKDTHGLIYVNGHVRRESTPVVLTIGFLPEGFRPQIMHMASLVGSHDGISLIINILVDGEVRLGVTAPTTSTINNAFALDTVFRCMQ